MRQSGDSPGAGEIALRRLTQVFALACGGLAAMAWLTWGQGRWQSIAFGANFVPMAPSTSLLFLLLGGALFMRSRWPAAPLAQALALGCILVAALFSALLGAQFFFGYDWPAERWLAGYGDTLAGIPVGRMSPITALAFLLAAIALGCQWPALAERRGARRTGLALTLAVLSIGSFIIAGYAADTPFFYSGRIIPMALLTAMAFVLLALGLLTAAGHWARLLRLLSGHAMPPGDLAGPGQTAWSLAGIFVLLSAAIAATGIVFLQRQQAADHAAIKSELKAVADLKAAQIAAWRNERLREARLLMQSPSLREDVVAFLDRPGSVAARERALRWLDLLREGGVVDNTTLFDAGMTPRLAVGKALAPFDPQLRGMLASALARNDVHLSDLHRPAEGGSIHLEMLVPVAAANGRDFRDVPFIVLQIDPERFLFPLIQDWPMPSASGETLLVRRDGDDVLFLNELRHRAGTALKLRLPARTKDLPSAHAVLGGDGVIDGLDYRGVPVVAAFRSISETPWHIVAKVDQEEIYAPLRSQAVLAGIVVGAMLLGAALGTALLWRQRTAAQLRSLNELLERQVRERTYQLNFTNKQLESFAYSVSHDLRSPLRGIDGWSLALLEDYGDHLDATARGYLDTIRSEIQRMGQLIDDLLQLSRVTRSEIQRKTVDLSALAWLVAQRLKQALPGRQIEFVIQPGLAAEGDANLLEIALTNLLGNACKFTGTRAAAQIEFGIAQTADPETGIGRDAFFVRDNGVGFDMAYAQKLFGAFQRLHEISEFPGNGIGLATVQRIVHRHHGKVWAQATPGQGATFFFTLGDA